MNKIGENLSILIYTSQNYVPIAKLCVDEFNKYGKELDCDKYIVSNSFNSKENLFDDLGFNVIDANVEFRSDSTHYANTLIKGLENVKTKYVLLWYDDYLIIDHLKVNDLSNLVRLIDDNNVEHFSFMSYSYDWDILDTDYEKYFLPKELIKRIDKSYYHRFSIQPTIWKVDKLIELLSFNQNIKLHEMDCSIIKNKQGKIRTISPQKYDFWSDDESFWDFNIESFCFNKHHLVGNFAFDESTKESDYLFFKYSEIIRGGKFNRNTHRNNKIYIEEYIIDKVINNPLYDDFL